jgi:hypothetical protein
MVQNLGTRTAQVQQPTLSISVPHSVAAGTTIAVEIATFNTNRTTNVGHVQSVRDSGGNRYVVAAQAQSADLQTLVYWTAVRHPLHAGNRLTVQLGGPMDNVTVASAAEFAGVRSVNPVDRTQTATGSGTHAITGATAVTSQSRELIIGAIGDVGAGTPLGANPPLVFTPNKGYSGLPSGHVIDPFVNLTLDPMYRIVNTKGAYQAGGSFTGGGIFGPVRGWAGAIVTFRGVR